MEEISKQITSKILKDRINIVRNTGWESIGYKLEKYLHSKTWDVVSLQVSFQIGNRIEFNTRIKEE